MTFKRILLAGLVGAVTYVAIAYPLTVWAHVGEWPARIAGWVGCILAGGLLGYYYARRDNR